MNVQRKAHTVIRKDLWWDLFLLLQTREGDRSGLLTP